MLCEGWTAIDIGSGFFGNDKNVLIVGMDTLENIKICDILNKYSILQLKIENFVYQWKWYYF